jgi:CRISPR-associated protein Cas5d
VERGQCHHRIYLGCREFAADFGLPDAKDKPIAVTDDLGRMLFDLDYAADGSVLAPRFFEARLDNGVLYVDPALYDRKERKDAAGPPAQLQ